jgi:hypothetical protein
MHPITMNMNMFNVLLPRQFSLTRQKLRVCRVKPLIRYSIHTIKCSVDVSPLIQCIPHSIISSCAATVSKLVSFSITYPFESCKLYLQLDKKWKSIPSLYNGFPIICISYILQQFMYFNIFYGVLNVRQHIKPMHHAVFEATIVSSLLSSFVKAPLVFIGRNMVFENNIKLYQALHKTCRRLNIETFKRCWITNLICDMPDVIIKFTLNYIILLKFPGIDHFSRNLLVGLTSSILGAPLDFLLTKTTCQTTLPMKTHADTILKKCFNGIQYKLLSVVIGNVMFSRMFNMLQPYRFY